KPDLTPAPSNDTKRKRKHVNTSSHHRFIPSLHSKHKRCCHSLNTFFPFVNTLSLPNSVFPAPSCMFVHITMHLLLPRHVSDFMPGNGQAAFVDSYSAVAS